MSETFRDLKIENHYGSSVSELLDDFYIPVIEHAVQYDRAAGYFSSAIFTAIEASLSKFVSKNGKLRIVCSPFLSVEDAMAINDEITNAEVARRLEKQLDDWDNAVGNNSPSSILRRLIQKGNLEIKIAVPISGSGLFHDKFGVLTDSAGEQIAFEGSVNESLNGWTAYGNHEHFSVFKSWDDRVSDRVKYFEKNFQIYWNNLARRLRVLNSSSLPEVFQLRSSDLEEDEAVEKFKEGRKFRKNQISQRSKPSYRELQKHQVNAITQWNENGKRGIIDFVTGGGKTVTALAIAREWLSHSLPCLVLVPSELLVNQWIQEIQMEIDPALYQLAQVGAGVSSATWAPILRYGLEKSEEKQPLLIVATYDSARSNAFLHQINITNPELLIIADEVHAIGSKKNRIIMDQIESKARLGLSATPERYGDEDGTNAIFEYFGEKITPTFGIAEAIAAGRLVEYNYTIHPVYLTGDETEKFDDLTVRIRKALARNDGQNDDSGYIDKLRRDRANLVKQAENKISAALEILDDYFEHFTHWLIYCNSLKQIDTLRDALKRKGINSLSYHSEISKSMQEQTLSYFEKNGGILIAVHCLDQGVDIPKIDAAVVIASSTNPREYIQRRGRILRWSPGKFFADLHDTVTLTDRGEVALESDVIRAMEIARFARNGETVRIMIDDLIGTVRSSIEMQPGEDDYVA
jgi:superfamily II DNA or RNA helicase